MNISGLTADRDKYQSIFCFFEPFTKLGSDWTDIYIMTFLQFINSFNDVERWSLKPDGILLEANCVMLTCKTLTN